MVKYLTCPQIRKAKENRKKIIKRVLQGEKKHKPCRDLVKMSVFDQFIVHKIIFNPEIVIKQWQQQYVSYDSALAKWSHTPLLLGSHLPSRKLVGHCACLAARHVTSLCIYDNY